MRKSVRWVHGKGSGQGAEGCDWADHWHVTQWDLLGLQTHKGSRPIISLTVRGLDQRSWEKAEGIGEMRKASSAKARALLGLQQALGRYNGDGELD